MEAEEGKGEKTPEQFYEEATDVVSKLKDQIYFVRKESKYILSGEESKLSSDQQLLAMMYLRRECLLLQVQIRKGRNALSEQYFQTKDTYRVFLPNNNGKRKAASQNKANRKKTLKAGAVWFSKQSDLLLHFGTLRGKLTDMAESCTVFIDMQLKDAGKEGQYVHETIADVASTFEATVDPYALEKDEKLLLQKFVAPVDTTKVVETALEEKFLQASG